MHHNSQINSLVEVTAPAELPLTIPEAKSQLRLEIGDDDADIKSYIVAARIIAETFTHRSFVNTTWDMKMDHFPNSFGHEDRVIRPTRSRLVSVTSVKFQDVDDVTITLVEGTDYEVDTSREPGRIVEVDGTTWPSTFVKPNAVVVRFVAGFGTDSNSIPENIKIALKMIVSHLYENRESSSTLSLKDLPIVKTLLRSSLVPEFA